MKLVVLPGDGIGPEICAATLRVLERAGERYALGLQIEQHEIGLEARARHGTTAPQEALDACLRADGILLGPISHASYPPVAEGGVNLSAALRLRLDLYANVRPARTRPAPSTRGRPMDLVIVRENTGGFYADRNKHVGGGEFMPTPDVALAVRKPADLAGRLGLAGSINRGVSRCARARGREAFAIAATAIEAAVDAVLADPDGRTRDLGGRLGTRAFAERLCGLMQGPAALKRRQPNCRRRLGGDRYHR